MKPSEIVESALETLDGGSVILRAGPPRTCAGPTPR